MGRVKGTWGRKLRLIEVSCEGKISYEDGLPWRGEKREWE
jgi:hypothetical protein